MVVGTTANTQDNVGTGQTFASLVDRTGLGPKGRLFINWYECR